MIYRVLLLSLLLLSPVCASAADALLTEEVSVKIGDDPTSRSITISVRVSIDPEEISVLSEEIYAELADSHTDLIAYRRILADIAKEEAKLRLSQVEVARHLFEFAAGNAVLSLRAEADAIQEECRCSR